jgi:hypothetical protein
MIALYVLSLMVAVLLAHRSRPILLGEKSPRSVRCHPCSSCRRTVQLPFFEKPPWIRALPHMPAFERSLGPGEPIQLDAWPKEMGVAFEVQYCRAGRAHLFQLHTSVIVDLGPDRGGPDRGGPCTLSSRAEDPSTGKAQDHEPHRVLYHHR